MTNKSQIILHIICYSPSTSSTPNLTNIQQLALLHQLHRIRPIELRHTMRKVTARSKGTGPLEKVLAELHFVLFVIRWRNAGSLLATVIGRSERVAVWRGRTVH